MIRGTPPSRTRVALLRVISEAGPQGLSLEEAALRAGVDIAQARTDVSNMRNTREVCRVNTQLERCAVYAAHIVSADKRAGLQPLRLPGSLEPHADRPTQQREKQPPESLAPKAYSSNPAYLPRSTRAMPALCTTAVVDSLGTHDRDPSTMGDDQPRHYTAPELRPFTGRPGAQDAFNLPSLQNGKLHARRPPLSIGAAEQARTGNWA